MALDCLYINGMLMMLVLGIVYASSVYFEPAHAGSRCSASWARRRWPGSCCVAR